MERNLEGQTVAVVAASSGIGRRAVAALAARMEAEVAMFSRSLDRLTAAAASIEGKPGLHPVANENAREAVGTTRRGGCGAQLRQDARPFNFVKAAAPRISSTGSIVMMCGAAALRPPAAGFSLLTAEAAAIPGFGRALARELAPIRVNVVMAGVVDTPIHNHQHDIARWAETSVPARRFGQPDDIADAILFAMCNHSTTGSLLIA